MECGAFLYFLKLFHLASISPTDLCNVSRVEKPPTVLVGRCFLSLRDIVDEVLFGEAFATL